MRRLCVVLVVVLACKGKSPPAPATSAGDVTKPPPAAIDATVIDAAAAPGPFTGELPTTIELEKDFKMSIGIRGEIDSYADEAQRKAYLDGLVLRVTGPDGKPRWQREGFTSIAGVKEVPKLLLGRCDEYEAELTKSTWGDGAGVRVSIACRAGEDMFRATEYASLLELTSADAEPFPPLWSGEADQNTSENDVCTSERILSFALAGTTLTITTAEASAGRGTSCGKPKKTTERVTVQRRPK